MSAMCDGARQGALIPGHEGEPAGEEKEEEKEEN